MYSRVQQCPTFTDRGEKEEESYATLSLKSTQITDIPIFPIYPSPMPIFPLIIKIGTAELHWTINGDCKMKVVSLDDEGGS